MNNTVITMTKLGYIKTYDRMIISRAQHRGGKGIKGMQTIDNDYIEELFMTTTHHYIMFFTNTGTCVSYQRHMRFRRQAVPQEEQLLSTCCSLQPDEKITAIIPIKEYEDDKYLFMATKNGIAKKTPVKDYANVRKTGLAAITLREDDELIEVKITDDDNDIFLVTKYGQCIRFHEKDVRSTGRTSMGVIGMNLSDGDEIIGMQIDTQGEASADCI